MRVMSFRKVYSVAQPRATPTPKPPAKRPQPPARAGDGARTLGKPGLFDPTLEFPPPTKRPLKVYAFDPSMGHHLGNNMVVKVRYEPLEPGPIGERFAVVDYDSSTKTFNRPVNLDDPKILVCDGLDPTESDPRFHQQMVYAVASETLERFEAALGRRVHWRPPPHPPGVYPPNLLYLFPHAMAQANAFYTPSLHGIVFGYYRAGAKAVNAQVLPGQTIFTCLSHDIIAHETTHAIVDGIRPHFLDATQNVDVAAFHEAFADLAALFNHFAHRDALLDTLQRTGGKLYTANMKSDAAPGSPDKPLIQGEITPDNPLIELARQFGQVGGSRGGLRSALGTPANVNELATKTEPHDRGSILVAAVFDAYFSVYMQQTADLFRVFRAGGGSATPVDLPGPLATLLADEASRIAALFFGVCARALDYCPPADVTFGDFLRAIITADMDLFPSDTYGVRDAVMQAFRSRGIVPTDAQFFSEDALCWPAVRSGALPPVTDLVFGDPNGLTREEGDKNGKILRAYAETNRAALGFGSGTLRVPSFHPMFRTAEDGTLKIDMIVEIIEFEKSDPKSTLPPKVLAGATLIIAQQPLRAGVKNPPEVRYLIGKNLDPVGDARTAAAAVGLTGADGRIDLALLHAGV
jgi:hypothetical protein